MILFVGNVSDVVSPSRVLWNYITVGFAGLFAILCIINIVICSVKLKRNRNSG